METFVRNILVNMEVPALKSELVLPACVQQELQALPANRIQEMNAFTTLAFMETALTKLEAILAIVKRDSRVKIVTWKTQNQREE